MMGVNLSKRHGSSRHTVQSQFRVAIIYAEVLSSNPSSLVDERYDFVRSRCETCLEWFWAHVFAVGVGEDVK